MKLPSIDLKAPILGAEGQVSRAETYIYRGGRHG